MQAVRVTLALAALAATLACVPRSEPPPPAPAPAPQRPAPAPPPPAPRVGWQDAPLTPGTWTYRSEGAGSQASYGDGAALVIRCDPASRQISIVRAGAASAQTVTIRTTYGARSLPLTNGALQLAARDPLLDQMAFSRGRFTVEVPGTAMLIVPSWAEPARVIEDCRG